LTRVTRLFGRLKSLVEGGAGGVGASGRPTRRDQTERLAAARERLVRKDRQLERAHAKIRGKDQEIARLQAELARAQSTTRSPGLLRRDAPVFFILGRARSGTTWLKTVLDSHAEILCRGEGWFFDRSFKRPDFDQTRLKYIPLSSLYSAIVGSDYLRAWVSRSVWTGGRDVDRHLDNLTRLAVDYFLGEQLSKTDKRIVGDKTPFLHAEVLSEIGGIYPEAKVIHIIRDGRDVAVSTIHHMWNHAKSEGGIYDLGLDEMERRETYRADPSLPLTEGLFTESRLANLAAEWNTGVGKAIEDGPMILGDNYVEVRYEDLLKRPVEEVTRLLAFLGADTNPEMVRRCVESTSFEWSSNRKRGQEDSSSFFRKGVAGDWRNVFTEEDKRIFKQAAGGLLIKLGYEEDSDW